VPFLCAGTATGDEGRRRPHHQGRSGSPAIHPAPVWLPAEYRDVTTILVMSEVTLPLAEIKKRLSEIVDGVEDRHDRVVLTRNGRPAAVILSPDDLEALEDTLDLLSDPKAMRAIRKAEADIDAGKAVDAAALRAKYLKP
jgi:antitoxin YefM